MKKFILEITVFLSGAVVMILELTGSRILAPYVGASLYVWTSLIGIILACLSIGYSLGGKLADHNPSLKLFSFILFLGSCSIALTAMSKEIILNFLRDTAPDLRVASILASILLFALPSVVLGMVSPYAISLKMKAVDTSGKTVGNLYAISTVGSIVGTFVSGFYLMAFLGVHFTLYLLSGILLLLSFLVYSQGWKRNSTLVFLLVLGISLTHYTQAQAEKEGFIELDTQYNHVIITNTVDQETGRPIRIFTTDAEGIQSAVFLDKDDDLVFPYTRFYRLVQHFRPNAMNALTIGGGAYTYPRDFLKKFPNAQMDVVEIDPELTKVAQKYFYLQDDPRLHIFHEDGRTYINTVQKKYDAIFLDAFHAVTPPFQLNTREAVQKMYDALNENGVILVNVISALEGDRSKLLQAVHATYGEVFPQVYVFQVRETEDPTDRQSIMLIAVKSQEEVPLQSSDVELNKYLKNIWKKEIPHTVPVLTDNFAPIEWYSSQNM